MSVYNGNTADPETLLPELERLRARFGLARVVITEDRGMVVKTSIDALRRLDGVGWISPLKGRSVRKLIRAGLLEPLDEQNLFELAHPDFPGERLVACRNPRPPGDGPASGRGRRCVPVRLEPDAGSPAPAGR